MISERKTNFSFQIKPKTGWEIRETAQKLAVGLTFDLSHGAQVLLKAVVKLGIGDGLEVTGVNTPRGRRVAAFAHAGVVAQAALVQVRVSQGVLRRNALGLEVRHNQDLRKCHRPHALRRRGGKGCEEEGLTGSKTSILQRRWTASWVAWLDSV